ncbi:MAG: YidC/Oxa1 family membrane protein insertase [Lachnospiraceae bacterium]|nr:YidC/Oxa1 family membrane protein insertase [Lachnospiraceae bacterium]
MYHIILTQSSTFLIGDIAKLLGIIMNWLFEFTSSFGIENIGLSIILFTLVVKTIMFPMTIKQQKFSKISAVMNPEIRAIQEKYKGKSDQESMMRMQEETKAVYAKYGTSPTGGCLQLLIQLPILYALFRVINNIPAYVASVKAVFMNIVTPLMATGGFVEKITPFAEAHAMTKADFTQANYVIDLLYKFTDEEWMELIGKFPDLTAVITENMERINHMNNFLGINLAESPGFALTPALLIPILSGVTQWLSTKLMTANQPMMNSGDEENTMASSMKMMNNLMPLMSAFFCITMPAGLGIYWVATSVFMIIQQLILNMYFNRMDIEELIMKNLEKANKKRAKKGLPPQKVSNVAKQTVRNIENAEQIKEEQKKRIEQTKNQIKESTEYYNKGVAKPGSLAAKANMVQQYNERTEKKKK